MKKDLRTKLIIVFLVFIGALYFLYPTFKLVTMSEQEKEKMRIEKPEEFDELMNKSLKLGLDLKGGMHLVLEVDDSKLKEEEKKDVVDRALEVIRNRVDQFGVSEPVIQKEGRNRIIVQLPGLQDAERAKRLIGETAMLEWRLVREQKELAAVLKRFDEALLKQHGDSIVEVEDQPADTLGAIPALSEETQDTAGTDFESARSDADSLLLGESDKAGLGNIPLETVNKEKPFTSLLFRFYRDWVVVKEDNIERVRRLLSRLDGMGVIPEDSDFMWFDEWVPLSERGGRGKFLFLLANDEMVSGKNLNNATPKPDPEAPQKLLVQFNFNRTGARHLASFTGKNVGRFTAIILDGKIKSYPVIRSKIPSGRGVIEGNFTDIEARDLSIVLRAGALPADMRIIEERSVGPTLGRDSIRMGIKAALLGLAVVVLFIFVYYKISGVIASATLIFNLLIVFGLLAYLGAALTLPGLAGVILTIGMAIDANVLIFERIREELNKKKTVRSSVDAGFSKAFTTIVDANLTTLITAFVLWQFGTGPVKGFATTLSIGILGCIFTALVFSRMVFDFWTRSGRVKKLSI
ncbi:MAG: protein translocase subunit SecD [Candidatus Krumholzibacteriota bacterium]|nr:protein translocase subunit SecD [Candidatus Krumholzibacteriota bacterium]